MGRWEAVEMILLMEVVEEVLGSLEVVGVQTMMALYRQEPVVEEAEGEMRIVAARTVLAVAAVAAMQVVVEVVVVAVMVRLLQVERVD